MINERNEQLGKQASVIRTLFEIARMRKEEIGEDKVFDFSIGNPSVDAPSIVKDSLIKLINETEPSTLHAYTSSSGDTSVKKAISKYLNETYNASTNPNLIYMTCGAAASLAITFHALINQGDEAIILKPYFPEYKVFLEEANAKVVEVNTNDKMHLDVNEIDANINEFTKLIIINSPNNPSGVVYEEDEIISLSALLKKKEEEYHHPIYLVSDEPYRELIYIDIKYPFVTNYYDDSIICYSFSKSLSLPGERIGYILVSNTCFEKEKVYNAILGAGRSIGYVCAPVLFQKLVPYCLGYTADLNVYKQNLKDLSEMLENIGYTVVKPYGAFYLFVKALEEDDNNFSKNASLYNLFLVPSSSFGLKGYVRIAYCVKNSQIKASKKAFTDLYNFYKEEK